MRDAPKVIPPNLLRWPTYQSWMLVVWQERLKLPINIPLFFVAMRQMVAERQSHRMASDMEMHSVVELNSSLRIK